MQKSCGGFRDGMCRANGPVTPTDWYTTIIYEQKKGLSLWTPLESSTFYTVDDMLKTFKNPRKRHLTLYTSKLVNFP